MLNRKKILLITGGLILIAVFASLSFLKDPDDNKPVVAGTESIMIEYEANFVNEILPGFDNFETAKKFGFESFSDLDSSRTKFVVKQELYPEGGYYFGKGMGELYINGLKYDFAIESSLVEHEKLKSGDTLLWGSFDAKIKVDEGKPVSTTVSFTMVPETAKGFYYVMLGGVFLPFGNDRFASDEIREIVYKRVMEQEEKS